ncbi:SAF domain-containing protein [Dermatophilaceae bacterium Soc4.6]
MARLARVPRVPRGLRGLEAGRAAGRFGLDPEPEPRGVGWPRLPGGTRAGTTRRAAWRRAQARRVVAAVLAGAATWLVVSAVAPRPVDSGVSVVVAAHDLALGARVGADDVRVESRPGSQRPASALAGPADALGQVTAGPVGVGEVLTTSRFRGAASLTGLSPALVAMSIPLVDEGLLVDLRAGDTVTVLAPGTGASVAAAAPVLSVTASGESPSVAGGSALLGATSAGGAGSRLVVGLTRAEAGAVAGAMGGPSGLTGFVVALGGR